MREREDEKHPPEARASGSETADSKEAKAPDTPSSIVGIGASAGGLETLELFFDPMPPDTGMAFIVVQHLSPDYNGLMAHILGKNTRMPLVEAEHDMLVEPNRVYLIPPRKNMTIFGGRLQLTDFIPRTGQYLPIDMFFRSLAADYGSRAIAVVLSGAGCDGSGGIKAIKEAGGFVIAQDSRSAKFDGTPSSAYRTGVVDFVLTPRQMAEKLLQHARSIQEEKRAIPMTTITIDQYIQLIFDKIKQASGIDFTYYKRNSALSRIERRMSLNNVPSIADYLAYLGRRPEELHALRNDLLIGVTDFFRDAEAFKIIYEKVLPRIFENKSKDREIRVWVAGCSTGEEAYSIAILMRKYADLLDVPYTIKIFATDLDKESIEYASQGIYSESINSHLSEDDINRFFIQDDGMFQVTKEIRKMVVFAEHNIIHDPPFSNLDLATCRNMLIYLQPEMQVKVLSLFQFALTPEGFLFLGPSETIGKFTNQFEPLDRQWNIFTHKNAKLPNELRSAVMSGRVAPPSCRLKLQSVNEELVTVNTEFQFKIQELIELNNDINNFLVSTRIGTIFLDKRMCIRRFTPAITKDIHLMDVDYGRPIDHFSHHFKNETLVDDARNVLRTLVPLEKDVQSKSGAWYSMRIMPYRTEDNFVSGVVLTFVDITDLKTANEELLKLSYAIEQSPSMTMMTDTSGIIEYVNPQFTQVTGFALDEACGLNMRAFSWWEEIEPSFEKLLETVKNGGIWTGELRSRTKSGGDYWESVKIIPIKDDNERLIHFVKLSEDISARKNAEEMLRKTEMLSAVGQLAAGIAHEIRNPLTALKGFTKLISAASDSKNSYIDIMLDELNRIEQIVSELLVLAKPQAVDFVTKELEPIVQDVLMLLESQANLNGVEMISELEPGLRVNCVENQLKQVFINLLKNAIEAMPNGGRIHVRASLESGERIVIRFSDNGAGIPESKLAKLGEPFYSTKEKGTGLGLMVSHKIIENHLGAIRFQSKVGVGTTVSIDLPAAAE